MAGLGLYAPRYYGEFECIKGECRHSCCIGWEIDVDDVTVRKYRALSGDIGERIRGSISNDGEPHFMLLSGDRCPHLDECGLCRIITELGSDYLSDICRLHPRFFNDTLRGREVGLGVSCEEACRIILSSDGYSDIIRIDDSDCDRVEYDALTPRRELFSILSDRSVPYTERLTRIHARFSVSAAVLSDGEWREVISSLEYLGCDSEARFLHYSSLLSGSRWDTVLERALAYFVYRHVSIAKSDVEFRTGVGFALFCERLLASVAACENISAEDELFELARLISEEIEYSSDNTDSIMAEIELALP